MLYTAATSFTTWNVSDLRSSDYNKYRLAWKSINKKNYKKKKEKIPRSIFVKKKNVIIFTGWAIYQKLSLGYHDNISCQMIGYDNH